MDSVKGRTAAVTGGGNGIGQGIARGFARAGANVVVLDVQENAALETAEMIRGEGGRAIGLACDVTSEASLEAAAKTAVAEFGAVHVLSNNAGVILAQETMTEQSEADWFYTFDVNVFGIVRTVQAFLPTLRAEESAHIVNTSSMGGLVGSPYGIYTASKFACVAYSECLRTELAPAGIGVSVLCPGLVHSSLSVTSAQNRPARYGGPPSEIPAPMSDELRKQALDPIEIGPMVIDAIVANRAYVYTNTEPAMGALIEARTRAILADLEAQRVSLGGQATKKE